MVQISPMYSLGDKVVHRNYGVGQIEGIESKSLNGIDVECYKVITENSIFWFSTDKKENPRVHPVASQKKIKLAEIILKSPSQELEEDPIIWKERIDKVQADGDFLKMTTLLRDLASLKTMKKLSRTQDQALSKLEDRLLKEWSASTNTETNSIQKLIVEYLQEGQPKDQDTA
jgi:RNA polymerase-interacting CarD/CdnL/TRCF family regulator